MAGFWGRKRVWPGTVAAASAVATVVALGGIGGQGWGSVFRGRAHKVILVPGPGVTPFVQGLYRIIDGSYLSGYTLAGGPLSGGGLPDAQPIGSWELTFHGEDPNEAENVALCVRALDGAVVPPGAVFSFNDTVGERTAERGFRPGLMYVAGQVVTGMGGGVCIPSTALYNAALNADMEIVERHNHSGPVSYATPGLDAAVVFGMKDFRFRNTSAEPIAIRASVMGNTLAVGITGKPVPGRRVVVERVGFRTLPFEEQTTNDATIPEGEPQVKQEGRSGWVATVVRTVYQGDKVVRRETISRDTVAPRPRLVLQNPLDDPASPEALAAAESEDQAAALEAGGKPGEPPAPASGAKPTPKPVTRSEAAPALKDEAKPAEARKPEKTARPAIAPLAHPAVPEKAQPPAHPATPEKAVAPAPHHEEARPTPAPSASGGERPAPVRGETAPGAPSTTPERSDS